MANWLSGSTGERPGWPDVFADNAARLPDSAGDLEVLADEDVVRPTELDHVDGVRAVAQLQHTVDGAAGYLASATALALFARTGAAFALPDTPLLELESTIA